MRRSHPEEPAITYRVLGQDMFPLRTVQVSAAEVSAAGDRANLQPHRQRRDRGHMIAGARRRRAGGGPGRGECPDAARSLPGLLTELAAAATDETRRPAGLVVTIDEVAAGAGSPPAQPGDGAASRIPLAAAPGRGGAHLVVAGIRDFIAANAAALSADIPLLTAHIPSPPPGLRGPNPARGSAPNSTCN